jgi:hypothetical protein
MNSREVGEILGYLSAAWPKYELFPETVKVWIDQFSETDFEVAQKAARKVVAEDNWFPSVSRFIGICKTESRMSERPLGCDHCDNGFVISESGVASFCGFCRQAPRSIHRPRVRELHSPQGNWEECLEQTRKKLKETK